MLAIKDMQFEHDPGCLSPSPAAIAKVIQHEREQVRQIRRIVCLLMDVMAIPDGNQYGAYFGDGSETDNREALTTWIRQILPEIGPDLTEKRLLALRYQLNRHLSAANPEPS